MSSQKIFKVCSDDRFTYVSLESEVEVINAFDLLLGLAEMLRVLPQSWTEDDLSFWDNDEAYILEIPKTI